MAHCEAGGKPEEHLPWGADPWAPPAPQGLPWHPLGLGRMGPVGWGSPWALPGDPQHPGELVAGASNVLPPTGSVTCLAWLLAWLLERICRGTVPVSPSRAASPTAAHQNASRPRAAGRGRCCPCLAAPGRAARSLPASLQQAGMYICNVPCSLYVGACVFT